MSKSSDSTVDLAEGGVAEGGLGSEGERGRERDTGDGSIPANRAAQGRGADGTPDEFDDPELKTSPEVLRPFQRSAAMSHPSFLQEPSVLVSSLDGIARQRLVSRLRAGNWQVREAASIDALFEQVQVEAPQVALIDRRMQSPFDEPIPTQLRKRFAEGVTRLVAWQSDDTGAAGSASEMLEEGYDDFLLDMEQSETLLARCQANLRASRTRQDLQLRKQRDEALLELGHTLASSMDLKLILHTVCCQFAGAMGQERCAIVLLDLETDEAMVIASSEERGTREQRIRLADHPDVLRCAREAKPLLLDAHPEREPQAELRAMAAQLGQQSLLLFPVLFEGRVTGVFRLSSALAESYIDESAVRFGEFVASACAVAIRNAHLYDSIRDHTERMNYMRLVAERQMEALKKYEDFFEYAAEGMAIVNTEGTVLYVNREGRRLLGSEDDELRERDFLDFVADESRLRWDETVEGVLKGKFRRSFDFFVKRQDGEQRVFWLSAGGVGRDTGLIILSFRDVTETREMELELRTTKEFLENLIDNSVDAIVAADMSGQVILFNKGAEQLYGYSAEEVVGRLHVSRLYPEHEAQEIIRQLRDPRWGGRGRLEARRNQIRSASDELIPISMTASLIYEDGEEVATVGVLTDLRERIKIEQRLSEAQQELLKTEKARVAADLAGMAAHELNQPLTSVLGYAEMLRHRIREDDVKTRRCVDTIYSQAERMAEIVRKVGRITRYETKHYGAKTTMMDLERASAPESAAGEAGPVTADGDRRARGASAGGTGGAVAGIPTMPPRAGPAADPSRATRQDGERAPGRAPRPTPSAEASPAPRRAEPGKQDWLSVLTAEGSRPPSAQVADIIRPDTIEPHGAPGVRTTRTGAPQAAQPAASGGAGMPGPRSAALIDGFELDEDIPELEQTNPGIRVSALSHPPTQGEPDR